MNEQKKSIKKILPQISRKRINMVIWGCFGFFLITSVIIFTAISKGYIGYMPAIAELENPIDRYASQVFSEDGVALESYSYSKDNRIHVKYDDLPTGLIEALIATEDIRFAKHSGIDVKGLMRAVLKRGFLMQKSGGGGSTITQQLAKQLYSPKAGNIIERILQKPIEWVIAVQLEKYYTKEEIINMYLNKFDFLYNAVGIQSAARAYFNKVPKNLKMEESATLIGMCKNPSYFNPVKFNERTKGRRNTVLHQMKKYGYIDALTCDSLSQLPLKLNFTRIDHKKGLAPYFREYLRLTLSAKKPQRGDYPSWQQQKFTEDSLAWANNPLYGWCNKNTKANGDSYNIYTDGLKIYTTLNSRMQQYAEEAVREHIGDKLQPAFFKEAKKNKYAPFTFPYSVSNKEKERSINEILNRAVKQSYRYRTMKEAGVDENKITRAFKTKTEMSVFSWEGMIDTVMTPLDSIRYYKTFLRTAFMAMDSHTGYVRAYIGGIDFANFQYDMVTSGRRQIGSTMKPFLYSLAMANGFTPCDEVLHVQQHLSSESGKIWSPKNSSPSRIGEVVSIKWGLQNSSNWITAYLMKHLSPYSLRDLLRSYGFKGPIDPVVAMCLGTPDISVSEMVSAYTVFTNKGIRIEPMYVTRIEDSYGNTVASFTPRMNEVLSEDATYKMLDMLQSVVSGGTGSRIRRRFGIKAPMGGKTGTTQNNSDGWYMGFTPSLVAGCWVGGEDRSIHFRRTSQGQGASTALPVYALFMKKVYADKTLGYSEEEKFNIPDDFSICSSTNKRIIHDQDMEQPAGLDDFFN